MYLMIFSNNIVKTSAYCNQDRVSRAAKIIKVPLYGNKVRCEGDWV